MLMTTSYMVMDRKESKQFIYYECVSLNEFNKSPIETLTARKTESKLDLLSLAIRFDLGSIIDKNFKEQYEYFEHKYELARVLGEDKENQKLLVYGAKIGEQIIDTKRNPYHNYTFYQRDDLLLLKQLDASNKFSIIHNITQAQIKAERDAFGQRAR